MCRSRKQSLSEAARKATRPIDRCSNQVVAAAEAADISTVHQHEAISRFCSERGNQLDRVVIRKRTQRPLASVPHSDAQIKDHKTLPL